MVDNQDFLKGVSMFTVYMLKFASGKNYIGQAAAGLKTRLAAHRRAFKSGSLLPVHCAWRAHGEPEIVVLCECPSQETLHCAEIALIAFHGTLAPGGYNVSFGGDTAPSSNASVAAKISAKATGRLHSPETKEKISAELRERWKSAEYRARTKELTTAGWTEEKRQAAAERARVRNTGSRLSAETIEKLRAKTFSAETRSKMSAAAKGKPKGPRTEETRSRLSAAIAASWADPEIRARRSAAIKAAKAKKKEPE